MIEFKNITYSYGENTKGALNNLSFLINRGEFILLTGKSGSGKSTILEMINGIIPQYYKGNMSGEVLIDNQNMANKSVQERSLLVGTVFQNPKSQFFHLDTYDELTFGPTNHMVEKEEIEKRATEAPENYDIKFENVDFSYANDVKVLENLNLHFNHGELTALVGRSGSGKTTITNLIARFWDVNKGEISIGGVDISKISTKELYKHISMVFQKVYLFNDTIYNNIAFGRDDATKEDVIEAAKKARCYDFIMALNDGFDTMVTSGGSSLSGGEKQRISIARAILKDAPIILLDEATASIDLDNEHHIQEAINDLVEAKTLIVIAHKLSSIKHADNIIVVDNGEIKEQGSHE